MADLFDQETMNMEREVRDLKTAHRRGLGTLHFFRANHTKNNASSGTHSFQVRIKADEPLPALIMAFVNEATPTHTPYITTTAQNYGALVQVYNYTAGNLKLEVLSTSAIEEITEV